MTSGDDRGSATVFGCAIAAALVALTVTAVHLGGAVVTRHRVQAAADLSALAVAAALDRGADAACGSADPIVTRMRVRLRGCRIEGWDAVVEVAARTSPLFGGREAAAVARAGPAGT
ncbi:flp pilus-assembly TadE/G-like family protein [Rhodococcus sp. Z13]|uniref:Flp pilus-assembly TadE/G-like family protein n=1 Tax=Rhodococcus sacchari TaxID=2962047 RepID=A0ACD4DI24_9NOCA|nr:Rv3654c family TadE-like protein [Rhodococcus sp. Z13]UYP19348.1 flp pilus-assembly TadE/G-like family protein [Rhodococcus sp. Z13]